MDKVYTVYTTACCIEDFEQLAIAIPMKRTATQRHKAAVLLRDELRNAYGDDIATVAIGEDSCRVYDPDKVTAAIDGVRAYLKKHPQATECQVAEDLRNPVAGLYCHYIGQCGWDAEAWTLTKATVLYNYALGQMRAALLTEAEDAVLQTTVRADELLMAPYQQGDSGPGANSEYSVDGRLQTEQAKKLLSIIEGVTVRIHGKGEMQALNTGTTPWSYASKGTLRYVAKCVGNILHIPDKWHVFMKATGAKNLQQCSGKEPQELYEALKKEGYKEFDKE